MILSNIKRNFARMKRFNILLLIIVAAFIVTGFSINNSVNRTVIAKTNDSALTESNVYKALLINGIKYPEVVMSQIMLESSNLTSRLCLKNNNLLGMTVPGKRNTTAINKSGYAKYRSWFESVVDYKLYQDYILSRHNLNTKKKYIAFLHKNYAKDVNYRNLLISMSKEYELRNPYYYGGFGYGNL